MENVNNKPLLIRLLIRFFQGMLIGIGGILPGVSGGVMCVIFGLYKPLMDLLANPFRNIKKHWMLLSPVILGGVVGFFGFTRILSFLMGVNEEYVVCAFAGLTLGMVPSLYRSAGKQGRSKRSYIVLACSFCLLLGMLMYLSLGTEMKIEPNMGWFFFCGCIWGLSIIVPGLSSSTCLIFFGLYQPMVDGISALSMQVIIPLCIGIVICVVPLANAMNYLFKRFYSGLSHAILGFVLATSVMIIPHRFDSVLDFILDVVFIVLGFFAAYYLDKLSAKFHVEDEMQEVQESAESKSE